MVTLKRFVISLVIALTAGSAITGAASDARESLAERPVGPMRIRHRNVHLVLSEISDTYNIPIGLEMSPDDDLSVRRDIVVRIDRGTIGDVLDSVIRQNPLYSWRVEDGVINVFPRHSRDPVLNELLETKLPALTVTKGMGRYNFRQALTSSAELRRVLEAHGVEPDKEIFQSRDVKLLGRGFSLEVSDATVKSILNRVIKESETRYWLVNRDGPQKRYVLLKL